MPPDLNLVGRNEPGSSTELVPVDGHYGAALKKIPMWSSWIELQRKAVADVQRMFDLQRKAVFDLPKRPESSGNDKLHCR